MTKMYDGLMKSGKFTAAQNKGMNGDYVDSVSELVAICESEGFHSSLLTPMVRRIKLIL